MKYKLLGTLFFVVFSHASAAAYAIKCQYSNVGVDTVSITIIDIGSEAYQIYEHDTGENFIRLKLKAVTGLSYEYHSVGTNATSTIIVPKSADYIEESVPYSAGNGLSLEHNTTYNQKCSTFQENEVRKLGEIAQGHILKRENTQRKGYSNDWDARGL